MVKQAVMESPYSAMSKKCHASSAANAKCNGAEGGAINFCFQSKDANGIFCILYFSYFIMRKGKFDISYLINGILGGLVGITGQFIDYAVSSILCARVLGGAMVNASSFQMRCTLCKTPPT